MEQCGADFFEVGEFHCPFADTDDRNALADFLGAVVGRAEQRVEPGNQGVYVRRQHAALVEVDEQMLHGEQCMDFL